MTMSFPEGECFVCGEPVVIGHTTRAVVALGDAISWQRWAQASRIRSRPRLASSSLTPASSARSNQPSQTGAARCVERPSSLASETTLAVFVVGSVVTSLGLAGLVIALVNFRNTPFHQPVAQGLYRISRHPQIVMSSVVLLGGTIAIGSWAALLALAVGRICGHFGILGEEEVCLKQYGDSSRAYLKRVPRYFLFF